MRHLITALLCIASFNFMTNAHAEAFDLQNFLNTNEMIDFAHDYQNIRLFVAEKASGTPFTDFNINEADVFFLGTYSDSTQTNNASVYFDRHYQVLKLSSQKYLNFNMEAYDFGIYPLADALNKTIQTCHLENEVLTSVAFNHPATAHDILVYLFTTQNRSGSCVQSLFDTFHKTVSCSVSPSSCYVLTGTSEFA